ncbi:LysE family translocator [Marinitoga litoralis]|uniref:LysE family translocator n=1 Tax=Marinitoga litoralis TaxID=570855 RepID=UPI00195FAB3C|nr:LysE family translocator [Marinitoga litoralis]MBM7560090.1 threonine/homoserine/homoserine lactone efflux protein [Marinitoga litoralis]
MNWLAFLSLVIIASWTPGPNNILSMAHSGKYGYKKTVPFLLGVSTGFFIVLIISGLFNYWLYEIMPKIKFVIGTIGFLYLLYLAYVILKSSSDNNHSNEKETGLVNYKTGVLMQFINPKAILFSITITGTFIIQAYNSISMLIILSAFLGFVAFLATSTWGIMGSILNRFLSKYEKIFNITMAVLLVYTAFSVIGVF